MPLGSDALFRDMLSRLIYGSRYTLLFCGVSRSGASRLARRLACRLAGTARLIRLLGMVVSAWSAVPSSVLAIIPVVLVNRFSTSLPTQTVVFVAASA